MKIVLAGCGLMGLACAAYLMQEKSLQALLLIDHCSEPLEKAKSYLERQRGKTKIFYQKVSLEDASALKAAVSGYQALILALPWSSTRQALLADLELPLVSLSRPHYGELAVLLPQLAKSKAPRVLACGLEPGLTEILAARALEDFASIHELAIRCGGIPLKPRPPLAYLSSFYSNGLPFEAREAYQIENGVMVTRPRFSDLESLKIDGVGELEAWQDGMLPWLSELKGLKEARKVTQKTLRWPGYAQKINLLNELGFMSKEQFRFKEIVTCPKEILEAMLTPILQFDAEDRDTVILRVEASGIAKANFHYRLKRLELRVGYDEELGFSAMAKVCGSMLAYVGRLLAEGEITEPGYLRPEEVFNGKRYLNLLNEFHRLGYQIQQVWL